jgi:uncharacterized protein (TIGR04552 family)
VRRDVLELDLASGSAVAAAIPTLADVEAVRLLLSGGSVVDWQRLAWTDVDDVDRFLATHLLDMDNPADRERLRYVFNEAVSYLEENLGLRFPSGMRNPVDVREVFLWASQPGRFRKKQILACVISKLMHVIHHMEAADLKFRAPIAQESLFDLAEAQILRMARRMREEGVPVVSFYGSRKSRASMIAKLLAKKENLAATIFDELRFRLVVERHEDLFRALSWMTQKMFPFNYAIPGQSYNNLLDPNEVLAKVPRGDASTQVVVDEPVVAQFGKNEFSGASYRMINFIVDFPVRLPSNDAERFHFELGRVVYVLVEFQLLDEETARNNETGENAHHLYKQRQQQVVEARLKRGGARRRRSNA